MSVRVGTIDGPAVAGKLGKVGGNGRGFALHGVY